MAGIYLHIPFCKQACHYCDFHFSTSLKNKEALLAAMSTEMVLRKEYLKDQTIDTIYFGGGTPSLLSDQELVSLLGLICQQFEVAPDAEITLEANPDDLTKEKLQVYFKIGINRLSIGIQSFRDADLQWMNRAHSGAQAIDAVLNAKAAGFRNITIDLIYGLPGTTDHEWKNNLQVALTLDVPHISAYCLTVEPGTALGHWVKTKKVQAPEDAVGAAQFEIMTEAFTKAGYVHYEISNFCKPGCYSRHNSSYWRDIPYLGVGPSAHSYDGTNRGWNVSNNAQYIRSLEQQQLPFEIEELTTDQRYNDYVLTSLRTIWGSSLEHLEKKFGKDYRIYAWQQAEPYLQGGYLMEQENTLFLTEKGKLLADKIASDLFK